MGDVSAIVKQTLQGDPPPAKPQRTRKVKEPCDGCVYDDEWHVKVPPKIPPKPKVVAVGLAPGGEEEKELEPFVGRAGKLLRDALRAAGLIPGKSVGFVNLSRCRPAEDDFTRPDWGKAVTKCRRHMDQDVDGDFPLLLLGQDVVERFLGARMWVRALRGLWTMTAEGRQVFVAYHPAHVLRSKDPWEKRRLEEQFKGDIRRMADHILNRVPDPGIRLDVYASPQEAEHFLLHELPNHPGPWSFDVETFDVKACPSRPGVAVNPFHPDFRIRLVAYGLNEKHGVAVDCREMSVAGDREGLAYYFSPGFLSPAPKTAFNGSFDEEGVTQAGLTPMVVNRCMDGMLGIIAAGDGSMGSNTLERAVVDVLGFHQYWDGGRGADKSRMGEMALEVVARGGGYDAVYNLALCNHVLGLLSRGEYLTV